MIKKLLQKLKECFSDKSTDTWQKANAACQPAAKDEPAIEGVPEIVGGNSNMDEMNEMRNKIIRNGFTEDSCSSTIKNIRIVEPDINNPVIPCESENDEFTENGLMNQNTRTFFKTAEENFIAPEEINHGGLCSACRKLTDKTHLSQCAVCRRNICSLCMKLFDDRKMCPDDYRETVFNNDTWGK